MQAWCKNVDISNQTLKQSERTATVLLFIGHYAGSKVTQNIIDTCDKIDPSHQSTIEWCNLFKRKLGDFTILATTLRHSWVRTEQDIHDVTEASLSVDMDPETVRLLREALAEKQRELFVQKQLYWKAIAESAEHFTLDDITSDSPIIERDWHQFQKHLELLRKEAKKAACILQLNLEDYERSEPFKTSDLPHEGSLPSVPLEWSDVTLAAHNAYNPVSPWYNLFRIFQAVTNEAGASHGRGVNLDSFLKYAISQGSKYQYINDTYVYDKVARDRIWNEIFEGQVAQKMAEAME